MSVVVYKDGVMAADTRAYSGGSTPVGHKMKIFRLSDGSLFGVTTSKPGLSEALVRWMEAGMDDDALPDGELAFSALWVRANGEVYFFSDSQYPSGPLAAPYFATGSGERYALGAFAMGANAEQAVNAACMFDGWCASPVAKLELHPVAPAEGDYTEEPNEIKEGASG